MMSNRMSGCTKNYSSHVICRLSASDLSACLYRVQVLLEETETDQVSTRNRSPPYVLNSTDETERIAKFMRFF